MANVLGEVVSLRDRNTKVFETDEPGRRVYRVKSGGWHYQKPDGSWDDAANLISDVGNGWVADTSRARVGIEAGYLTFTYKGRSLTMRPTSIGMVDSTAPATRWRKLADASYANVTRSGGTVTVHDIFPNTDLTLTITDGRMDKAFTIRTRPTIPDPSSLGWNPLTTYVVIVWDVNVPAGAEVRDSVTNALVGNGYTGHNDLVVKVTATGEEVLRFLAGHAVSSLGRSNPIYYVSAGANVPFGEAYAYSKGATATYPLVWDPTTVVGQPYGEAGGTITTLSGAFSSLAVSNGLQAAGLAGVEGVPWSDGKGGSGTYDYGYFGFIRLDLANAPFSTVNAASLKMSANVTCDSGSSTYTLTRLSSDYAPLSNGDQSAAGTSEGTKTYSSPSGAFVESWSVSSTAVQSAIGGFISYRVNSSRTTYGSGIDTLGWSDAWLELDVSFNGPYIADIATGSDYNNASVTVIRPAARDGDIYVALSCGISPGSPNAPSPPVGGGWTVIGSNLAVPSSNGNFTWYWATATAAGVGLSTVWTKNTSTTCALVVMTVTNVNATSPVEAGPATGTTSANANISLTLTTGNTYELLIAAIAGVGISPGENSSYMVQELAPVDIASWASVYSGNKASAGSDTVTFTPGGANNYRAASMFALKGPDAAALPAGGVPLYRQLVRVFG